MKIALDAGHGGTDPGTSGNGIVEKDFTFDMVERIGHYIRAAGKHTFLTRPEDKFVDVTTRARRAVANQCTLFLSVHCNGARSKEAKGKEAFVAPNSQRSTDAAEAILGAITGLKDRGVKLDSQSNHVRLGVLRGTVEIMPAVLVEIGFCTNAAESKLMKSDEYKDKIARAIAEAILSQ